MEFLLFSYKRLRTVPLGIRLWILELGYTGRKDRSRAVNPRFGVFPVVRSVPINLIASYLHN